MSAIVIFLLAYCVISNDNNTKPYYAGLPASEATIIENIGFTIGYSEIYKNPIWVAYHLFKVDNPVLEKEPSRFKVDERTEAKVSHDDYTNSGYDRGHMAPNYAIATRYGREAQLQTFLMSNICPQLPSLKRQIWKRLEYWVVNYRAISGIQWIVTGPVFDDNRENLASGVEIPNAFYKIVVDEWNGKPRMLAFLIPQDVSKNAWFSHFRVSVDSIESVTSIDFFSELEDSLEDSLEAITN
ncbi:MAG: DNA/RNA non-specific endonuclease [Candidatus Hatepunaea meridiana]|nr:DNA/RNA non-specific endonuclease [Candidatus Hatepunaea meridiana]